ncbi:hypothetical protein [Fischerella thermalis]|nr:hypothetical protein [Fischerella thermalis]PLZ75856.1 hypothetical protein CBP16_23870 [Fischerella thermalis WC217]RDH47122.1 hypothetical protein CBF18_22870 [Mastigocladus laminosus WC112]PLZ09568.1 hypothetical protein CBP18_11950 [Fischerella thermalis WC119]PLZ11490.1 hypothetical protein CBP17_09525 [Fischerella thermalis WC114]PLZ19605.1 hypothetical protein CBP29_18635 [Fischerella thermalis WC341]
MSSQDNNTISLLELLTILEAHRNHIIVNLKHLQANYQRTKAMTVEELTQKYPHLQFSKDEQEGTFFIIGDSIISVYATRECYSKKDSVAIEK